MTRRRRNPWGRCGDCTKGFWRRRCGGWRFISRRDPAWPAALLLLFVSNQVFATRLETAPRQSVGEASRSGRLVKSLLELTAEYVELTQVGVGERSDTESAGDAAGGCGAAVSAGGGDGRADGGVRVRKARFVGVRVATQHRWRIVGLREK